MLRRHWSALAAYAALTVILTWPLAIRGADHQLGGGVDPWLFIWTIGWNAHAFTRGPLGIFDAPIFYPHPNTLAYSEHLIGPAMLGAPALWLTGNAVLATNIAAAVLVWLCAAGGYFLGRRMGLSRPAAFVCGLIFAFTPPRFGRIYQMHQNAIFAVPFALGFLHTYLRHGRGRDLRWTAAMFSVQALMSGHGTALLLLGAAMMLAHAAVTKALAPDVAHPRKLAGDLGIPGALLPAPVALMLVPYWRAREEAGLVRALDDAGITASSWLTTTSRADAWLISRLPDWPWLTQPPDVALFPGILVLALAVTGIVLARRERSTWLLVAMIAMTVWMTIGPPFGIWRFVYWLPGLSFIRVPSRFMLLGMLALAVLAAIGFERLTRRVGNRGKAIALGLTAAALAIELSSVPLDLRAHHIAPYPIDRYLDTLPKPFSLVEIPVPQSSLKSLVARRHAEYMLHSMAHFQPIVQGYSGIEPPGFEALERTLMMFPDTASLDALAAMHVTYAVVHMDYFPPELVEYARTGLERFEQDGRLRLLHTEGAGRLYAIVR